MTNRLIMVFTIIVLAICLVSGGCVPAERTSSLKNWKDLIDLLPEQKKAPDKEKVNEETPEPPETGETIVVSLYFVSPDGSRLAVEEREVFKTEGIGRRTIEELLQGPASPEYLSAVPEGTRLLDINVKPDGLCIVDLSSHARRVSNQHQEKLMVYAMVNTLGQFPTVNSVTFMINGEPVTKIGGYLDLTKPIEPNYNL